MSQGAATDHETLTRFLAGLQRGSDRLTALVENLLLALEVDAGLATERYTRNKILLENLPDIFSKVASSFEPQAEAAEVALTVDVPPNLPPIEGNEALLIDALGRVIDNAIRFSSQAGAVQVRAEAKEDSVIFEVADQGRGIQEEEQDRIFDMFHQVDRAYYEQQGAGVGLTIAKGLVALHGGKIGVESEMDVGSVFSIELPVASD
jgi:two-component system phosphate regulon sensor histidine kinase PhoR